MLLGVATSLFCIISENYSGAHEFALADESERVLSIQFIFYIE